MKILDLQKATKTLANARINSQKIGLITGCFDVLHEGHIDLFRFAKEHVDILIVALDSDQAIKQGKGKDRPIHNISQRAKVLSELESVDFVLPIEDDYIFTQESVEPVYDKIQQLIKPNFLITTKEADSYWKRKEDRAKKYGGKLLLFERKIDASTTKIAQKISSTL